MQDPGAVSLLENVDGDSNGLARFDKSLQELKDLRSQLRYAADYCEKAFLKARQKKMVMENTKEYICRAVVTVVDHLGSVSANLESRISQNNEISEAELRIDCLKQRLLACEQYAHRLALAKVHWSANFPMHHPRYVAPPAPALDKTNSELMRYKCGTEEEMPLLLYTYAHKLAVDKDSTFSNINEKLGYEFSSLLPVGDGQTRVVKLPNPSFHFQDDHKLRRDKQTRKPVQSNDILSLIRRSK
ncbi:PREDICTED: probable protein ABIL5 [Nelumbo nucifera]|uniref:Protein ABIL5 n=2 Tax=Nelumbo nucifera TaxID=4432 RepID=A0A822Y6D2_NELNU|nr:PREDICTED: probable protein ABIL5 [Nelumbo nucifera]DAD26889.1 TPA_asm: hypothetical protein HUJ06_028357 [Nelumbo nucifera]